MTPPPAAPARPTHRLVADFERVLGDPLAAGGPFAFAGTVEHEERDELPPGAVELLREWGLATCFIPERDGGRLRNLETAFGLTRSLSRRNLTLAVMFGSAALGAQPVWLWGDEEQRALVAGGMLAGDLACFGASEPDHGSDLNANETVAVADGEELVLTGEKWPVGNATRGRFVTVLARLEGRGHCLVLVDKERLAEGEWSHRPFVRPVGLRGHDLSGIVLHGARVPRTHLVGRPGQGLVEVLKTLQITRTAIGAMSLGTMDSALRIGLDYAHERQLYGGGIYRLPVIREHLVGAHLDLLAAECTALPVARALSVVPSRMSLWSSVVKYLVPVVGEEVTAHVGRVLGARSYLREGVAGGAFQKLQRDHAVASIFEGTTHVNLHNIATQLPHVAGFAGTPAEGADAVLRTLFDWSQEAPVWEPSGRELQLTNASQDEITRGWGPAVAALAREAGDRLGAEEARDLARAVAALDARRTAFYAGVAGQGLDPASTEAARTAAEHCVYHAAASCVLAWLHNAPGRSRAGWLILVLQRLLQRLDPAARLDYAYVPQVERVMEECRASGTYFSVTEFLR
ncbi:acyl-CoA dehydrogenase family protein [Streptomyces nondiastaticus]|uniref:acyl-CoA dehydrogenase family protein n=1 Tax=Streptomyces nondiastaticus TaxID=3154512 RepID=UPI003413ECCF